MPIIWRYLLGEYLKVFAFCAAAFIAILLTLRLDEIAHFATLGAEGVYILWYALYQVPYILPIAIPISCLISIVILIQRLSASHEMTAFRAAGLSLKQIMIPLLLAAAWLSLLNFLIVSEVATQSHLSAGQLKSELRSVNPLLLLHNKHLMRMKGMYFDTLGASKLGESASDVIIASPSKNNSRINIMIAKKLQADPEEFKGTKVTLITSLKGTDKDRFDHLMIENINSATTSIRDFAEMLQKKVWTLNNDHLKLSFLITRLQEEKSHLQVLQKNTPSIESSNQEKQIKRCINRCYTEIFRRVSIALAAFTFTFMGFCFGISVSRYHSKRGMIYMILLTALFLMAHFSAKGIDHLVETSAVFYFTPHVLIAVLSILYLRRASKGD